MLKAAAIIPLLFTSCLCQFVMNLGMKPDVTFGEQNDRFDVASVIQDQSRMDVVNPVDDYRRHDRDEQSEREKGNNDSVNEGDEKDVDKGAELLDVLKDTVGSLDMRNFAYHSNMDSNTEDNDYEKNLAVFSQRRNLQGMMDHPKGGHKNGRRSPPDPEILFNYGVPVNMKVEGVLQVPLEKR